MSAAGLSVLSAARLTTLISALVVALGSGTNYVYSAYAPQLGTRLQISHTKLNIIGLAGNVGVYSSGPVLGKLVDQHRHGPRILFAASFLFLLIGYTGIRHYYDSVDDKSTFSIPSLLDEERISLFSFCFLVLFSYLTGVGGNGGLTTSMNATAKSFPDQLRATTTGLVISGFGLSAFFFSTLAHVLYPGDTSSLLLLLALGTSVPMVIGFFFVRPVPLPSAHIVAPNPNVRDRRASISDSIPDEEISRSVFVADAVVYGHMGDSTSRTNLLSNGHDHHHTTEEGSEYLHADHDEASLFQNNRRPQSVELAFSPTRGDTRRRSLSAAARRSIRHIGEIIPDFHGKTLLSNRDFWLLFAILMLLSGTGLMYINNVGLISQALFAQGKPDYDAIESAKWQAMQVSIISVANCLGRILVGLGADTVKNRLHRPRSYCICVVAGLFVLSQVIATKVEDVENLWYASGLLGLAYGGVFGLFPTITIEWFGLGHFSENWGYVAMSPMIGGNLFSLAFGHNLDKHEAPSAATDSSTLLRKAGLPSGQQCFDGRDCYISSLYLTMFACSIAFFLSLYAAWKDRRRMVSGDISKSNRDLPAVIWEEEEEG